MKCSQLVKWLGLFLSVQALAQQPRWLDVDYRIRNYPEDAFITVLDSLDAGRKGKDADEKEDPLREKLYQRAARLVQTKVSEETSLKTRQQRTGNQFVYKESFESTSVFESNVMLSTTLNQYYLSPETDYLLGILVVDKSELAKALNRHCEEELSGLVSKLDNYIAIGQTVNLDQIKRSYNQIRSQRATAVYLDPDAASGYSQLNEEYNELIASIETDDSQRDFENDLRAVEERFERGSFRAALDDLRILQRRNPHNKRLDRLRDDILESYAQSTLGEVTVLEAKGELGQALNKLNIYLEYDPGNFEVGKKLGDVREGYYEQLVNQYYHFVDTGRLEQAAAKLEELNRFSDIDPAGFRRLQEDFSQLEKSQEKAAVMQAYNRKNYRGAWDQLRSLENRYVGMDEFRSVRKKVVRKLVREDIAEVKKDRPRLYSLFLRAEAFTEDQSFDEIGTRNPSGYFFAYSAGLYRKIRLKEKFTSKKRDISSADYIGLNFRLLDYQSRNSLFNEAVPWAGRFREQDWAFELGINAVLARCFHLQVGARYTDAFNWQSPEAYLGEFGLLIPMRRLLIGAIGQVETLFEGQSTYQLSAVVGWRFDAIRRFNREDRKAIRYHYR